MKRTKLDRFIGYFSPKAELTRVNARALLEAKLRAFDIAKSFPTGDWTSATKNSANAETKAAIEPGRNKARSLEQNNPYGQKAVNVIVSEVVGPGIVANIQGKNGTQTKKLQALWKSWAETTACDFEGQQNFYGLQSLLMRSTVSAGEGLALKRFDKAGPKIQILESDFIATSKDEDRIFQGVELDANGKKVKYHLYKFHPGDRDASQETITVPATELFHIFKKERPGQVRGVTWFHAVAEKMKDLDDFQYATLVKQKITACFSAFVTTSATDNLLDASDLKAKREAEFNLQPGTARYMRPGEDIKFASPPSTDGYSEYNRESLRAIASGLGISAESLTGDYSQSNYSSSRMGHLQMRKNIEHWRWNMLVPQFCDPVFKWFLEYAKIQGLVTDDDILKGSVTVQWVPPAFQMIDPSKEILSLQREVRSGFKSWKEALLEQGRDPERTLNEVVEWNKKFDETKVAFDTDPRRMSAIGFAQAGDALGKLSPEAENLQTKEEGTNEGNEDEANASE
jgi:lambda family phage portal protein